MLIQQALFSKTLWSLFVLLASVASITAESSVPLSKDTFDELTQGRSVFIKWFAPWCGHCQELAPAWDKMAKDFVDHQKILVGAVDCTVHEQWCVSMGISGFPTLSYGDPSQGGIFMEQYEDEKSYEALSKFANDTLIKPLCSPATYDGCDKAARKKLEKLWTMKPAELEKAINEKENDIKQADADFQTTFAKMQADYDNKSRDYEILAAKMRSNIKLLRALRDAA